MIKFYITYNAITREVFPLYSDLNIDYSAAKSYLLSEKSISNILTFTNKTGDYDYLMNIIKTNQVAISITKNNVEIFRSYFSSLTCTVNEYLKTIEAKLDKIEAIENFEKQSKIDHNLLAIVEDNVTIKIKEKTQMLFYIGLIYENGDIEADMPPEAELVISYPIVAGYNTCIFAVETSLIDIGGDWQWSNYFDAYYRSFTYNNEMLHNSIVKSSTQIIDGDHVEIGISDSFYFYYKLSGLILIASETLIDNQIWLKDSIRALFFKFTNKLIVSSLLFNDLDEYGNSIGNYIDSTADLSKLTLGQATDIKRYYADQNATIMNLSLNDLIEDLQVMFSDLKVFLDRTGKIRIEHIAYFGIIEEIDLTEIQSIHNFKTWTIDNSNVWRELLSYCNYHRFENKVAIQNISYFNLTETVEKSTKKLVSDISGVISETDIFSDDSVVITLIDSNNEVVKASGIFNYYLDFTQLVKKYHRHNRITQSFKINDYENVTSLTLKKIKKLEQIEVPFSILDIDLLNFDPFYYRFKTQLGENGEVESASYNVISDTLTLKLKYEL